jgi:diaminohydroxyphosphoribosylaminopyrimidine deaminase/5-amino-6-(5-phosphoribosylamino)uracil reductase
MVGSVIVLNDKIIGEGFHQEFGGPHAEVNAINSVEDKSLLTQSTIYVSLEPCSHYGKTPPCADLIIANKIPRVVIAAIDSNAKVCGNGIAKLQNAGIEVIQGVLENESHALNKAFNTFHQKKRPYITLKWAESSDGFIDAIRKDNSIPAAQISNSSSSRWVHQLRSITDAILIGKRTALLDNPSLTTRKWYGKNPLRIIIDSNLELPETLKLFNDGNKTLVFNLKKSEINGNVEFIQVPDTSNYIEFILHHLWEQQVQSLIVEGGTYTLQKFIDLELFDSIYLIKSKSPLNNGITAPKPPKTNNCSVTLFDNEILIYD